MRKLLCELLGCEMRCPPRVVFVIGVMREQVSTPVKTTQHHRFPIFGEILMAQQITATQQFDVTFKAVDKKGNPAKIDGVPSWSTDNSDMLLLTPSEDGMSCNVKAIAPLGSANVQLNADALIGDGVSEIIGTLAVEVIAGQATVVTLEPGAATEQPD